MYLHCCSPLICFEDGERVEWIMDSVGRGLTEKNPPIVYQVCTKVTFRSCVWIEIVDSCVLYSAATACDRDRRYFALDNIRGLSKKVKTTHVDVIRWMHKCWLTIKQGGGFV
jgi:hypothetical protein